MERQIQLRKIIDAIRCSLNINEIKKNTVSQVGQTFNADRCFIRLFDSERNHFLSIDENSEYLSSADVKSIVGIKPDKSVHSWIKDVMETQSEQFIPDIEAAIKQNNEKKEKLKILQEKYGLKSTYGFPIFYSGKFLAALVLNYTKTKCFITNDGADFLKAVADQIGVSLHHCHLYESVKQIAERESFLRKITELINQSFDVDKIQDNLVTFTGEFLKADRVCILDFNSNKNAFLSTNKEYLKTSEVKSLKNYNSSEHTPELEIISSMGKENITALNINEFIKEYNLKGTKTEEHLNSYNIKSGFSVPIIKGNIFFGELVIHSCQNTNFFTEKDVEFVKIIANQAGIAMYQSRLYQQEKQAADREKLLRNLVEIIHSKLEIKEVLSIICEKVTKVFDVDRITITQFTSPENYREIILRKEYMRRKNIKSAFKADNKRDIAELWGKKLLDEGKVVAISNISEADVPQSFKIFYDELGVKSIVGVPIKNETEKWGMLVLSELKGYRKWTEEEITLLKTISSQIFIAIKHAELLDEIKQNAGREKFLAEIISITKSVLDKDEIIELTTKKIKEFYKLEKVNFDFEKENKAQIYLEPQIQLSVEDIRLLECIKNNTSLAIIESEVYSKSRFFSDISHELRTPLAIIDGYANNLLDRSDYTPETVDKYLNIILKNTKRMTLLIENLITLSMLEKGHDENIIEFENTNVKALIDSVLNIINSFKMGKKITFEIQCEPTLSIKANSLLMEQAILNLVKNAVQHSFENSRIIIKAVKEDNRLLLSVQDFGTGIEEKHLNNIFKRFYKIDRARNRKIGGSGLGLSIVEKIVKSHNGMVSVVSGQGKGSTFTIEIPCF